MISVVVPTYNERGNISELIERLAETFSMTDLKVEVLIIDDDSPDGTAAAARNIGETLELDIRVIIRMSDPDLSRSVVRGFREARGDVIIVMDADLQHPPEIVPKLATRVSSETQIVVGSRYSDGGRIENWPLFRRVVSYGALMLTKLFVPPTRGVSDPISGFFAIDARVIRFDDLSPDGYKILVELLASVDPHHVDEVGFTFKSRERGETSLDLQQYSRFLRHVVTTGIKYRFSNR